MMPRRSLNSIHHGQLLVTIYLIIISIGCHHASASASASPSNSFGDDELTSLVDQDLFLEDESGSGYPPQHNSDLETSGSGIGPDDEDNQMQRKEGKKDKDERITTLVAKEKEINKEQPPQTLPDDKSSDIFENKRESSANFFSQPGILAAIICGAIVGLLCAILLVMFIVYRMRKKDEGSYVLEDSKRTTTSYGKSKEFFA